MKFYSGIGSRDIEPSVFGEIYELSKIFSKNGFILRTGGSIGSDEAFLSGSSNTELYLPWNGFNSKISEFCDPSVEAFKIAKRFHPNWKSLSYASQKLHARNVHIVLGQDCKSPSLLVIAWTRDGIRENPTKLTGGTGQGIRIANHYGVPVVNLNRNNWSLDLEDTMKSLELFT
jgi:hypothetical protein